MQDLIMGRYRVVENDGSVRIELGGNHTVLFTGPDKGEYNDVSSIGFGDCRCDIIVSENRKNLKYRCSELSFGVTSGAAVAIADLSSGICRAGFEADKGHGEVSLILLLGPDFSISSMARAGITAVEAITAAIQDLGLRDSEGRCGSGIGNLRIAVVSDNGSELHLRGTGKHSKMGEIIGKTVYDAVINSARANGTDYNADDLIVSTLRAKGCLDPSTEMDCQMIHDKKVITAFSALNLLDDEIRWGLIPKAEGMKIGRKIIRSALGRCSDEGDDIMGIFISTISMN